MTIFFAYYRLVRELDFSSRFFGLLHTVVLDGFLKKRQPDGAFKVFKSSQTDNGHTLA